jgi:hypothetical protein
MQTLREANLNGRERKKLREARENGYLDACHAPMANLLMAFALWCWRLKLPVVWFERHSPRSRYGRIGLDLYTTSNRLTERGLAEMRGLAPGAVDISPHDARWSKVPIGRLDELAARVIRAAVRTGNCERALPVRIAAEHQGRAKVIELVKAKSALVRQSEAQLAIVISERQRPG